MQTNGINWGSAIAGVDQNKWKIESYNTGSMGYVIDWILK
jgi:hypothetical protein